MKLRQGNGTIEIAMGKYDGKYVQEGLKRK
jgi:hypothetical protein